MRSQHPLHVAAKAGREGEPDLLHAELLRVCSQQGGPGVARQGGRLLALHDRPALLLDGLLHLQARAQASCQGRQRHASGRPVLRSEVRSSCSDVVLFLSFYDLCVFVNHLEIASVEFVSKIGVLICICQIYCLCLCLS